eukprot:UN13303
MDGKSIHQVQVIAHHNTYFASNNSYLIYYR